MHPNTMKGMLVLALLGLAAAGCARSPSGTHYTLSATEQDASPLTAGAAPSLAVGPAQFPRALSRSQIVNRSSPNRIELEEYHRWASSLEFDTLQALSRNLAALLGTERVSTYPSEPRYPLDYRVLLEVLQFDGTPGGSVTLIANWSVVPGGGGDALLVKRTRIEQATEGSGIEDLVRAHSLAVGELSRQIAGAIAALPAAD